MTAGPLEIVARAGSARAGVLRTRHGDVRTPAFVPLASTATVKTLDAAEVEREERGWYRVERATGAFSRSLSLPEGVDPDAVSAEFDKGELEVRIPKPEQRKPRKIAIGGGSNGALEGTAEEK